MRIFLLALMIILLPVRGWMGDVMAMEMATGSFNAINTEATNIDATGLRGKFNINLTASQPTCPDHAGMSIDMRGDINAQDPEDPATHGQCTDCSACQICHSVALTATIPLLAALVQPPQLRPAHGLQFASATTAQRLKPPIL